LVENLEEGGRSVAFSKKHKEEMADQYAQWVENSQAMFLLSYGKMSMKEIDALRAKTRESGSELHVVKNTLMKRVFNQAGIAYGDLFEGTTMVGFAANDPAASAKAISDSIVKSETFAFKGGFLGKQQLSAGQVKSLAELPPLPVMRATLLGVLNAPASKLVRTIAEPARGLAAVVKAYSEQAAPAAG
jgi:large subunit ribosomal protein L10